jgi:hypothetical protein
LSVRPGATREPDSAGTSPNTSAVSSVTPAVKASSRRSGVPLSERLAGSKGRKRRQRAAQPERDEDARGSAERGEQQALEQQLPHQPSPRRADRDADRHLLLARRGPRQQQARDVGAGDQQHERDEPLQHEQRLLEAVRRFDIPREAGTSEKTPFRKRSFWSGNCWKYGRSSSSCWRWL